MKQPNLCNDMYQEVKSKFPQNFTLDRSISKLNTSDLLHKL